ncbi:hypothetical protein Tco_0192563, partial [Tanacetum coccineum]
MPTIRTAEVNIATNDDERRLDLDILEERREQAAIREAKAKLKMKGYYDAKVRGWEGPHEVTEALGKGAYHVLGEYVAKEAYHVLLLGYGSTRLRTTPPQTVPGTEAL